MSPVTAITPSNQKYLDPSDVHHIYHTGCCQRGFVSSDLQEPSSSDPKDYDLLAYKLSTTPPS